MVPEVGITVRSNNESDIKEEFIAKLIMPRDRWQLERMAKLINGSSLKSTQNKVKKYNSSSEQSAHDREQRNSP